MPTDADPEFYNMLTPSGAALSGRAISFHDAQHYRPTTTARASWGFLKVRSVPR